MHERSEGLSKLLRARLDERAELRLRFDDGHLDSVVVATAEIERCLRGGGKLLIIGNGGSAADAQHIAAELVGRFRRDRGALAAIALTTDTSALTAIGNDFGFEQIFGRQVQALGRAGDIVLAISTSGHSKNVLAGVEMAKRLGLPTIGLTGGDGGELAKLVDYPIVIPSKSTPLIQECHITIGHLICEIIDEIPMPVQSEVQCIGFRQPSAKLVNWDCVLKFGPAWQQQRKTVVWTNGCFDLLHAGHVFSLAAARNCGDILVVGVNSDATVRSLKGGGRPITSCEHRMLAIAGLESVDYVVPLNELTPEKAIARLKPDIHCKGAEYKPPAGKPIPEMSIIESYGGKVEFLPMLPSISTSKLIEQTFIHADLVGKVS
jgi:phosphoheptose isomerase